MTKPNRERSTRLRSTLDNIGRAAGEAKRTAVKADDVLTSLEDREGRRASRAATPNPRLTSRET